MRRLVIDASVLLAAPTLLGELDRGLEREYFRDRVREEERVLVKALIRGVAVVLPDPVSPPRVVRDANDDYLVALARAAGADAIVTGDRDLLDHEGLDPPAVTPREACERLGLFDEP